MRQLEMSLRVSRPVLIGHNMLFDLCFLYNTFIGPLPNTWSAFRREIQVLFPRITDTKALALKDSAIEGGDPLAELFEREKWACPQFSWDAVCLWGGRGKAHNAGFDSKFEPFRQ